MNRGKVLKGLAIALIAVALVAIVGGGLVFAATMAFRTDEDTDVAVEAAVQVAQVTEDEDDAEPGIVIASVDPQGPAAKAGVARGDILLKIDGEPVGDMAELRDRLADYDIGDAVELTVLHGDDERTVTATLVDQDGNPYLGLVPCGGFPGLGAFTREMPHWEDLPFAPAAPGASGTSGALITRVVPDSPADQAGLQEGDTIVSVEGQAVEQENDLADLITAHNPGDTVTLEIERPGEESFEVTATLGEHPDKEGTAHLGVEYRPAPQMRWFRGEEMPLEELPFDMPPFSGKGSRLPLVGNTIVRVVEGSPAEKAGLQVGDRITKIDGEDVNPENNLQGVIADRQPGDSVTLEVERPGEEEALQITIELVEHPDKEGAAYLGVGTLPVGGLDRLREDFGLDELPFGGDHLELLPEGALRQGAVIREVAEDSPAAAAGLSEGDVITEINGEPVEGPQELVDAIADYAPGATITLTVYSPGDEAERQVEATLAEHSEEAGKAYLGVSIGAYFRLWRSDEGGAPQGMPNFEQFFERFHGQPFSGQGNGFRFNWQLPEDLDALPFEFNLDELPFHFELPPGLFEGEPVQPEQNTL
jgi:S1-C subfamily serine protease